ncbi:MAG: nicotinate (nicotinamide) nucleotide adenylyltransferase [Planctomycetia bacterium]|nr:nicotinate (nicotinamide) nucleotide adenylyltransferase [Planctomycetia bacterium]
MRIGVYGGSFDPVHFGHLIAAECAREQARLDRVVFVPAAAPPHKPGRILADGRHRLEMLSLAIGGHDAFSVSPVELDRGGTSYTIDTLETLATVHPGDALVLLLGPDALAGLPTWREPRRIAALAEIVPVERDALDDLAAATVAGGLADLLGAEAVAALLARRVRMPAIGLRATDVRAAVAASKSIRYRTPRAVERYIATHDLYR